MKKAYIFLLMVILFATGSVICMDIEHTKSHSDSELELSSKLPQVTGKMKRSHTEPTHLKRADIALLLASLDPLERVKAQDQYENQIMSYLLVKWILGQIRSRFKIHR